VRKDLVHHDSVGGEKKRKVFKFHFPSPELPQAQAFSQLQVEEEPEDSEEDQEDDEMEEDQAREEQKEASMKKTRRK
jgi:hypothetical protein